MRAAARRLRERLGRRGAYLCAVGTAWVLYGLEVALDPRPSIVLGVSVLRVFAPLPWFGYGWIGCGFVAVACGFLRRPGWDGWGFAAATTPQILWSVANLIAWANGTYPRAWTAAAVWGFGAVRLIVVAGWMETPSVASRETGSQRE